MFDPQGHVQMNPKLFYDRAMQDPRRLINSILVRATPVVFEKYDDYFGLLDAVSSRIGVHPMNLFVRGSCQLGYSISPEPGKIWIECRSNADMKNNSDIDLAIVDVDYFAQIDRELQEWESQNAQLCLEGDYRRHHTNRKKNRGYRCCNDHDFPPNVCTHHVDCMSEIDVEEFCGKERTLSAFIFRDWWSLRNRYESDLRKLLSLVEKGDLPEPPDKPFPRAGRSR